MIWDFRGPASEKTAIHHEIHLKEYIVMEKTPALSTGTQIISEMHAIAFMIIPEASMIIIRDALKPHRAEIHK